MARIERPFYPIIYVRGYAMTKDEIAQTTSTPYMGFEAGSTKIRQAQDGSIVKFVFESPLVRIENAYVAQSPRAFVHSGYFGIVNSEEGYQNLVRFLFGDLCATGRLDIQALPFPPEIERARKAGKKIESSYYIEATVAPRGAYTFDLTARTKGQESAVRRRYSELFDRDGNLIRNARAPTLFTVFLDTSKITAGSEVAFSIELAISSAGYEVDGVLFLKQHIPGEYLFRNTLVLFARRDDAGGWKLRHVWADDRWATGPKSEADVIALGKKAVGIRQQSPSAFAVPLESAKGFRAELCIALSAWD